MRFQIAFATFLLSVTLYGQNDYSLDFSGSNIELPTDLISDLNGFTFSAYFFADPTQDGYSNIVQQDPGVDASFFIRYENNLSDFIYSFKCGSNTYLSIAASSGSFSIPSINTWHHVAITYDGITSTAYLDGVIVGYEIVTGSLSYFHSVPMYIGNWQMQEDFNGNIDEVHIWNSALSQEQIQQYMNCPPTGNEPGLVGYWNFEEGSGTTAFDQTANGNDGTINGATWSTDVPEQNCQSDCTDSVACNFNPDATEDDGSCDYTCCPGPGCCGVGMNWNSEIGECEITNPTDSNLDGCTDLNDLMNLLGAYGICGQAEFAACGDLVSHEGYGYSTVQIGEQCWFSENCRYLPSVSPSSEGSDTDPYYYVYDYEGTDVAAAQATTNYETYGVLYNWPAVMTEGICPSGWHIPSDGEFTELTDFLGGESVAGGKMKEAGYDHWNSPNTGATNSSGWTGLPGGLLILYAVFGNDGYSGSWWSSSSESGSGPWTHSLNEDDDNVYRQNPIGFNGFSARCVRD
jgi:uncharacterized protein (TIGR02145 family)